VTADTPAVTADTEVGPETEVIELTLPSLAELLVLVRYTAATLAARAEFSVEEIDDLRLAANELCLSVIDRTDVHPVHLRFNRTKDTIEISCTSDVAALTTSDGEDSEDEWSVRILDALVTEHGREDLTGRRRAWLRKRRARSTV